MVSMHGDSECTASGKEAWSGWPWAGHVAQNGPPNGLKASPELKAYWQGNCSVYSPAHIAHACVNAMSPVVGADRHTQHFGPCNPERTVSRLLRSQTCGPGAGWTH